MTEKGTAKGSRLKMIATVSGLALAATALVGASAPSAGVSPAAIAAPAAPPAPPAAPAPPAPPERQSGKRAWLGIVISGDEEEKVTIASVSDGSPADEAGLREGDRILEIDDEEVADADDVMRAVRSHAPGDRLRIRVERDGQNKTFTATLEGRSARAPRAFEWTPGEHPQIFSFGATRVFLGVEMHPMSGDLREHFRAPRDAGLLINRVIEDTAAERAGLKAGDVIIEVNGETIADVGDISHALREKEPGDQVTVRIVRDGSEQSLDVKLGERRGNAVPRGMIFAPDDDEVRAWALSAEDREELERSMQDVRREIEESMRGLRESLREYRDDQQEIRKEIREKLRERPDRNRVIRVNRRVSFDI